MGDDQSAVGGPADDLPSGSSPTGPPEAGPSEAGSSEAASSSYGTSYPAAPAPDSTMPDLRFFLPSGPPLPPKRWQRKWKVGIRLGSILVGVALVVAAVGAIVVGVVSSLHFTASGTVEVDCATRAKPFVADVAYGAPVTILDAETGEVYGSSTLGDFTALKSGICLVSFQVDDVRVASLYTVRIGKSFEALASADTLRGGALLR